VDAGWNIPLSRLCFQIPAHTEYYLPLPDLKNVVPRWRERFRWKANPIRARLGRGGGETNYLAMSLQCPARGQKQVAGGLRRVLHPLNQQHGGKVIVESIGACVVWVENSTCSFIARTMAAGWVIGWQSFRRELFNLYKPEAFGAMWGNEHPFAIERMVSTWAYLT
jgi:hypothetical protein